MIFKNFNLAVHNGLFYIPVYIDINKINYIQKKTRNYRLIQRREKIEREFEKKLQSK